MDSNDDIIIINNEELAENVSLSQNKQLDTAFHNGIVINNLFTDVGGRTVNLCFSKLLDAMASLDFSSSLVV